MNPIIIRFQLVPIDGLLADVATPYRTIAITLLQQEIEIAPLDPPHTLARLGEAAGLTPKQSARVITAICAICDFWATLKPLAALEEYRGRLDFVPIFYAPRPQTVGDSVLMQTADWFLWHGFRAPVIYITKDSQHYTTRQNLP